MPNAVKYVQTDLAPKPAGHYSQAVIAGDFVHISGQLPIAPDGEPATSASLEAQARLAIGNMLAILSATGCGPEQLAKVTVYLVGVENWPRFNAVYAEMLPDVRPARAVVPVPNLHHGCLVEVEAVALVHRPRPT